MTTNNFSASVSLNTGQSNKSIRALTTNVTNLSKALDNLDASIKKSNGSLDSIAQNVNASNDAMKQAIDASKQLAQQRDAEAGGAEKSAAAEKKRADAFNESSKASESAAESAGKAGKESKGAADGSKEFGAAQADVADKTQAAKGATDQYSESLASHRYLMYDVGATYRSMAVALYAIPAATSAVAIAYEKDFAQVQRTTGLAGDAAFEYNRQLKQLATEIPSTFSELAEVSKIGGQMGVAEEALGSFTETVVRFVETSDGVNIDKASTAFGRLENMFNRTPSGALADPQFFERIGSAISYTGDNSVATEAAIIGMLEKTTASAKNAGLSIQETIAMSSAMVSSGLQPFLSSGFIIRFFGNFQKAAAEGGAAAEDMARSLNMTAGEFQNFVRNDPYELLKRVVTQMKDMDSVQGKQFLTQLGINGVQDPKVLNALSENLHVLEDAMEDVNSAYASADYLKESSAGIFGTTAANIQMLTNSFMNLGATIGSTGLPGFTHLLKAATGLVSGFDDLISRSKIAQGVLGALMGLMVLWGTKAAVGSTLAFVNATLVMFRDAAQKGALAGGRFGGILQQLTQITLLHKGATDQQIVSVTKGRSAFGALSAAIATKRSAIAADTAATQANTGATAANAAAQGRAAGATTAATSASILGATAKGRHAKEMSRAATMASRFGGAMRGLVGAVAGFLSPAMLAVGAIIGVISASSNSKQEFKDATKAAGEFAVGLNNIAEFDGFDDSIMNLDELINKMQEVEFSFWDKPLFSGAEDDLLSVLNALDISGDKIKQVFESSENGARQLALELLQTEGRLQDIGSVYDELSEKEKEIFEKDLNKVANGWAFVSDNVFMAAKSLREMGDAMGESDDKTQQLVANGGDLSDVLNNIDNDGEGAANGMRSFGDAAQEALDAVFGFVNAEGALTTALDNMGKSLYESSDMSGATTEGVANIENYQRAVSAALSMMEQDLREGTFSTVQEARQYYESFFQGLEQELLNTGVDPAQAAEMTRMALEAMQMTLGGEGNELVANLDVDPTGAYETTTQTMNDIYEIIHSGDFEFQLDADGQPATETTWAVVNWIAEAMGITPAAVLDAIDGNATENTTAVMEYLLAVTNEAYTATLDADPTPGKQNVDGFYNYASSVLGDIAQGISITAANLNNMINDAQASGVGIARQMMNQYSSSSPLGRITTSMTPAQAAANRASRAAPKAPKLAGPSSSANIPKPDFGALNKGYNNAGKAAKKAGGAGKKAGNAGKKGADAAKKATDKAAKAAEKAAQKARDWNKAWQDLQSWAGRVGEALQMAFDKKHAVQSARDEYYSVLNGINERLQTQKDRVKELREETKRLTAERKVELNEASKYERMSQLAGKHGNSERAKDYSDQAKAMRERAGEMSTQISANKAEQATIQAGIGNLKGYSQAAIDNRNELRQLEQAALKVPEAYASIGASATTVANQTRIWTGRVQTHAREMGYTNNQVKNNTTATSNYIRELGRVPRNIPTVVSASHKGVPAVNKALNNVARGRNSTVGARTGSTSGTRKALDNVAKSRNSLVKAKAHIGNAKKILDKLAHPRTVEYRARMSAVSKGFALPGHTLYNQGGQVKGFNSGGLIPGRSPSDPREDNLLANVDNQGMIKVRSQEFIQPEPAVKHYGLNFMEDVRKMRLPKYYAGGSPGGGSGGSSGINAVDLSAKTINQLAKQLSQTTVLEVSRERLAEATGRGQTVNDQKRGIFKGV